MLRRASLVCALLVAVAAACTSFGSNDQTTAAPDASTTAPPPPPPPLPPPSSADAAGDASAACATDGAPLAFESFDQDGGWSSSWSPGGPSSLSLEAPAFSPPFALASSCMGGASCASGGPLLGRYVAVPACVTTVRFEAEVRIDSFDAESYEDVGLIALGPDGIDGKPHVRLDVGGNGAALVLSQLGANAMPTGSPISADIPSRDAFHKIAILIDYAAAPPTFSLAIDDVVHGPTATSPPLPAAHSAWQVRIGMLYTTSVYQPWTVRYDDVAFFGQ